MPDRYKLFLSMVDYLRRQGYRDDKQIREKINEAPSNFSPLLTGKRSVTEAIIEKMYKAFPILSEVDLENWVVTPDPEEIVKNPNVRQSLSVNKDLTPFYEEDFFAGASSSSPDTINVQPTYYLDLGGAFKGCIAFRVSGNSMASVITSGTVVFARELPHWRRHLEPGQIYGIVMTDGRKYLKYIMPCSDKSCLLLESHNKHFGPFEVYKEDVHSVWLVEGWLNKAASTGESKEPIQLAETG